MRHGAEQAETEKGLLSQRKGLGRWKIALEDERSEADENMERLSHVARRRREAMVVAGMQRSTIARSVPEPKLKIGGPGLRCARCNTQV